MRLRFAPVPLRAKLALGTTAGLLLVAVNVRLSAAVSASAKVKLTPKFFAGSVGSLMTPDKLGTVKNVEAALGAIVGGVLAVVPTVVVTVAVEELLVSLLSAIVFPGSARSAQQRW